jgi:GNAT superfamily N-acetyltransferase
MCDDWMPAFKVQLTVAQLRQLPRNPAYKYEYLEGQAYLTPRPKHYHALLELKPVPVASPHGSADGMILRPVTRADFPALEVPFTDAFQGVQPFASLDEATLTSAARTCLQKVLGGGEGPWLEQASFVAVMPAQDRPVGAVLVTLLPDGDPADRESYYWNELPPEDCFERRLGRPHLTWIFVCPVYGAQGVGTALLAATVGALLHHGYTQLLSTFLLGNDVSMLWHWRNGFQLLSCPHLGGGGRRQ